MGLHDEFGCICVQWGAQKRPDESEVGTEAGREQTENLVDVGTRLMVDVGTRLMSQVSAFQEALSFVLSPALCSQLCKA